MRMWHKDLINVLPREQLVAQWRELSAIAGNLLTKGTSNHILVNWVTDYPFDHFVTYAKAVRTEMTKRGYRTMDSVWQKILSVCPNYVTVPYNKLFSDYMNNEYATICYYNLKEKYNCGGIRKDDFTKIEKVYN